ncbi:MAG: hypothetical protein KF819_12275 [Labilithrix sp.]|nr:hypothetical protein [Labilithrix sp.]
MRRAPVIFAVAMAAALAGSAGAAPRTKRCIDAAETGQQLRSSGRLVAARRAFGACTAPDCPAAIRRDCARWIEDVDAAIPTISVRLEDENGREVSEGKVLIDGEEPSFEPSAGRALPIDPGAHKVTWLRSDGRIEQDAIIREGEHNRVILLRVAPQVSAPPTKEAPPPAASSRSSPWPWIVGGIGLAALGVGSGLWIAGTGERSDLERTCAAAHTCLQADVDASRSKLVVGDVFVGVGIVALAGALYLFLTADEPKRAATR